MTLRLALCLGLGGGGGYAPSEPFAPVFAGEPGALDEIASLGELTEIGFVQATGYPKPAYTLSASAALPGGVSIFAGDIELDLPATVSPAYVELISIRVYEPYTGSITLTLTASNGVDPDAEAEAVIPIDVAPPAPIWSPESVSVELPVTAPIVIGNLMVVDDADTIEVVALPNKGIYYIDDGDDTPLAVSNTFPASDLPLLTGESDGGTGAVTGTLTLEAQGDGGTAEIDITVSIAAAAGPVITERDFEIEEATEAPINFDLTSMPSDGSATIENTTTGDSAVIIKYEDLSA